MNPAVSVVIPTLNEEQRIAGTLEAARAAFGDAAEYIVADGGSTDATLLIAEQLGARIVTGSRGRGEQLHHGCRAAIGETCVMVHADTILPVTAGASISAALQNERVVGGAFQLEFRDGNRSMKLLQHAINLRTRAFRVATGDQVIFVRSLVLAQIGGVPRVPLFEDVRLCRALRRKGQFAILSDRVTTSARLWQEIGFARGVLLHLSFRALHALGVHPQRLARLYPSPR